MIIAKYKFDKSIYSNLIPVFNDGYNGYTISDEIDSENSNHVIRTIECDTLPTLMRFGKVWVSGESATDNRTDSLLEILDMNTSGLTSCDSIFRYNTNLTSITCNFDTSNVTTMYQMFQNCNNLISLDLSNFDTSKVTNMQGMFASCNKLTSLDLSNFDTSKVTNMDYMFNTCNNLISLDLSNFDTSNVTTMSYMFNNCNSLTSLDVSNFDTSKVTNMNSMFTSCHNLTSLDVSNWDTRNVTNIDNMFYNTSKLSDIGMLYCTPSTINTITSNLPTTHTQTIWVQDTKPNECTVVSGVEFKEYKENSVMINLNSPLLDGDRIEVVDGKLCHYHKMGKVVLDGSEGWGNYPSANGEKTQAIMYDIWNTQNDITKNIKKPNGIKYCDTIIVKDGVSDTHHIWIGDTIAIHLDKNKLSTIDTNGCIQYLQQNPTTVIYELAEPYYEDITPLQSDIVLETYLECNMDIYTDLPIKTNVSYITNVPSLSTLSMRATEMKESDNIIANLTNMLDNEINE